MADIDKMRKRRGGAPRDPSPSGGVGAIPVITTSPSHRQDGSSGRGRRGKASQGQSFSHIGRTKNGGSIRRRSSNLRSRWTMKLRKMGSPVFIGMVVVVSVAILAIILIATIVGYFSSFGNGRCNESHLNGIDENIYNYCYKNNNNPAGIDASRIKSMVGRSLTGKGGKNIKRIIQPGAEDYMPGTRKEMIKAINAHERLSQGIVAEDYDDLCYADLANLGIGDEPHAYHQPVIGPCHYDYPLTVKPRAGSYEDFIDFYFYRDSEETRYTDRLQCLNKCVDRVLVGKPKHGGHHFGQTHKSRLPQPPRELSLDEIGPEDRVTVDDVMLIEAARAGMTFVAEKLMVKHGLDPLYRQVHNDPSNSRNLNAVQEAIRGGYAEMVGILTAGDNSIVIDEYGRTVEDYVKMSGSPIRPVDARNVLGIHVEQTSGNKLHTSNEKHYEHKSGWSETTADPYDKDRCDFDIVDGDLSPEKFYKDYFITGRPVVFRGQSPQEELDMFSKRRWKNSRKFHPDERFLVGPTAYPGLTNQESCNEPMSINEIEDGARCQEMPQKPMVHAFHPKHNDLEELFPDVDGEILDEGGGFRSIQKYFKLVEGRDDLVWQVFFGGDGSGATYHWHEAAFNILYVGIKEWKIAPPIYRGTTGMTAQKVAATLDEKISLTCVQQPGDMFYIPNFWGHSTINHGFTIGAAAIVKEWYQTGGTTFRGVEDHDDEYEEKEQKEPEKHEEEEEPPFLFVHINKTGGTSLIHMFNERCDDEYFGGEWNDSNGDFHRSFHATAHAYIEKYGRDAWDNAFTFTVVRHPLARQVSNFFFLVENGCDSPHNKCAERLIPSLDLESMSDEEKIEAFHEWNAKLYEAFPPGSPNHYRFGAAGHGNEVYDTFGASQTSWLVDQGGHMVVKNIYKLEELTHDITTLAENIPCLKNGDLKMEKKNKTSKYPDYKLFAKDERTKKIINEVFAEDFNHLGYDPL